MAGAEDRHRLRAGVMIKVFQDGAPFFMPV